MARYVPTEKELKQRVKLLEITVKGTYIAAIDEKRKTSRRYTVKVKVPEGFTKSDIKRLTPRVLMEHKDYADFISMQTFIQDGKAIVTKETMVRSDLYSDRELARFAKFRKEVEADARIEQAARGNPDKGIAGDTTEYDPDTGLPKVINDDAPALDDEE